eukprot:m51a1_g10002 putative programmed cell death protein 2 (371) ;mRNA; f:78349-79754
MEPEVCHAPVPGQTGYVMCGFCEEPEDAYDLTSPAFPNKAGGKPAWLALDRLPSPESLTCDKCHVPMSFLLQTYAPLDSLSHAFHRTLFIFCCRSCSSAKVFRGQLPDSNPYYELEDARVDHAGVKEGAERSPLCVVCGCWGPKQCARCHTRYCSGLHQKLDWAAGHSKECAALASGEQKDPREHQHNCVLPETEIVTEEGTHPKPGPEAAEAFARRDAEEIQRKLEAMKSNKKASMYEQEDLEEAVKGLETTEGSGPGAHPRDKLFERFTKRLQRAPDQVLRYDRGGKPLWHNDKGLLEGEAPKCGVCGGDRVFEMQVLPQLLQLLGLPAEGDLDFGTLAVYTCRNSCQPADPVKCAYVEEYVWNQPSQ